MCQHEEVSATVSEEAGRYLTDRKVVSSFEEPHDEAAQKRLWKVSEDLTNLEVAS